MISETLGQVKRVMLFLEGLPPPWHDSFYVLAKMLDGEDHKADAVSECRRLLNLAKDEPRISGLLHSLISQLLFRQFEENFDEDVIYNSLKEGYEAQKLIDKNQDPKLWGMCEFNLGVMHEALAPLGKGNRALQHLMEAASHNDRACQVLESDLLAESLYRLGIVRMQIGVCTSDSDEFVASRHSLGMATKIYADVKQTRKEINALYNKALACFHQAELTIDYNSGVEALRILDLLSVRSDIILSESLEINSLFARALLFCSIQRKKLENIEVAAAQLQRVAGSYDFNVDPWGWLTAKYYLADTRLKQVIWTIEWKADPSMLGSLIGRIVETTGEALSRCDEQFPEHRRELTKLSLFTAMISVSRQKAGCAAKEIARLEALTEEFRSIQTTHPSTRPRSAAEKRSDVQSCLHHGDWKGAITKAAELLNEIDPKVFFLQSTETAMKEIKRVASIGDMAAYAYLMIGDCESGLYHSESSKSRLIQLTIAMNDLLDNNNNGHDFRAAREDWYRVDNHIKHLDRKMSMANAEHLPELLARKRALTSDFGAIANRLARILSRVPITVVPQLDLDDLAEAAGEGSIVISILVTDVGGAAVVLPQEGFKLHSIYFPELTAAAIQKLFASHDGSDGWIEAYQKFRRACEEAGGTITLADLRNWSDHVLALGERLWKLFLGALHDHLLTLGLPVGAHVKFILPGILATLPISAAWRVEDGRRRFIIEDWVICCAPSIQALITARHNSKQRKALDDRLLLVADENSFVSPFRACAVNMVPSRESGFPRVIDALRSGEFRYWSFGCHGCWDANDPRQSRLITSEGEALTVADLQRQPLRCRLALLGACESGHLDPTGALAEQIGIPAALVEAGVSGVVGSLWLIGGPVDEFLARVLDRHLKGETPALSLRNEQLALISRIRDVPTPSPTFKVAPSSRFGAPVGIDISLDVFDTSLVGFWSAFNFTGA